MGYGGGFYDKFFETINPKITRLGIGYFKQFVKEVPHDEYDKKLHYFLSENGLLTLGGH